MTTKVSVTASSLRGALSHWLERAQQGERIVVIRHGQPIAEISPPRTSADEPRPMGPDPHAHEVAPHSAAAGHARSAEAQIRPAPDVYLDRLRALDDGTPPAG